MSALRFDGWVPFRLFWQDTKPGVEWLYMGAKQFTDPFFEETIYFEAQTPFNSLFRFRTLLAALADWHAASPGLQPAGFIFHLSRCGSTLVTRMLASLPESLVLSEPGVVDRMLRSQERAPDASLEQRAAWLQWLVSALAQRRTGREQRLFIKFDPRNIADLPLLLHAFPGVPWIFVYRNPVEVLVSNMRSPARFVTPGILGPDFLDFDASQVPAMDEDEYAARVLGTVAATAARHAGAAHPMLVEYSQLPGILCDGVASHFGIRLTPAERRQLEEVAAFDAKHPKQPFSSDIESKRRGATPRLRQLAEQWIAPHYARLQELRTRPHGLPSVGSR